MNSNILYIIVPCYNEEEVLKYSSKMLKNKLECLIKNNKISKNSKILFVDDGSTDNTWNIIYNLYKKDKHFAGIRLSKNEGHQNALMAGLEFAQQKASTTISIDADLQDDINAIDEMIEKFNQGFNIVYGVRSNRKTDSIFKRKSAEIFYKFMNFLGAKTVFNHADFRLMDKKSLNALSKFKEKNLFLRGIIPQLGFKTCNVYYKREKRKAGISKYPLSKMIHFALSGITSCSVKPLRLIFIFFILSLLISLSFLIYITILLLVYSPVKSIYIVLLLILTPVLLLQTLTLFSLSVIAEYISKIYTETKKRPRYIISNTIINEEE